MQCAVHGDLVVVSWTQRIWKMGNLQWNQRKLMRWTFLIQLVLNVLWFCNQKVELWTPQMKQKGGDLVSRVLRYRAYSRGDYNDFKSTILDHQSHHLQRSLMEEDMAWFYPNGLQQLTTAVTFVFEGEGNGFLVQVIAPKPCLCCDQIQLAVMLSTAIVTGFAMRIVPAFGCNGKSFLALIKVGVGCLLSLCFASPKYERWLRESKESSSQIRSTK